MAKGFEVDIRGCTAKALDKHLREKHPKLVQQATVSALNKTSQKAQGLAARHVSNASSIKPQKLIRQRLPKIKANKNRLVSGIRFKHGGMSAHLTGGRSGIQWNREMSGAKAGKRTFKGSFTATPTRGKNTGKTKIYKRVSRTGSNKTDLRVVYVPLDPYKPKVEQATKVAGRVTYQKVFKSNFEWRLNKEIDKLNRSK